MSGKRLTPAQRERILALLSKGVTPAAVAAGVGCSRETVYAVAKAGR